MTKNEDIFTVRRSFSSYIYGQIKRVEFTPYFQNKTRSFHFTTRGFPVIIIKLCTIVQCDLYLQLQAVRQFISGDRRRKIIFATKKRKLPKMNLEMSTYQHEVITFANFTNSTFIRPTRILIFQFTRTNLISFSLSYLSREHTSS